MKGDDIIAVEKSLESEAWAQLWTLRITPPLCSLASQASNALYAEFGRTLPVSDGRRPPSTMPEVFPQPWRGALTEGWGPQAPFPSHSSWPGSLCGHRALLPSPCPLGDTGADFCVTSVVLGEL